MIVEEEPQVEVTAVEIAVPQEEEAAVTVETVETVEASVTVDSRWRGRCCRQ